MLEAILLGVAVVALLVAVVTAVYVEREGRRERQRQAIEAWALRRRLQYAALDALYREVDATLDRRLQARR